MEFITLTKPAFSVIGKEGSSRDGEGFVLRLWQEANGYFSDIAHLVRMNGGIPAGAECGDDALPPESWTKWTVPGFEYRCVSAEVPFKEALAAFLAEGYALAGAVQEFTDPAAKESWLCFPVRRL